MPSCALRIAQVCALKIDGGVPNSLFDHGPPRVVGYPITVELRINGTHARAPALTVPGVNPTTPTGKTVTIPPHNVTWTIRAWSGQPDRSTSILRGGVPGRRPNSESLKGRASRMIGSLRALNHSPWLVFRPKPLTSAA